MKIVCNSPGQGHIIETRPDEAIDVGPITNAEIKKSVRLKPSEVVPQVGNDFFEV